MNVGMSSQNRLRVVLVAVLAVAAMGGVVASAIVARRHRGPAGTDGSDAMARRASDLYGPGARRRPLPEGCEVDPAHPPVLHFDQPEGGLDFGALRQGVQVEGQVVVRNTGTGVLCVTEVVTGCGCVHADWVGDTHVAPGGSGTVRVRLDTTAKEGRVEKDVRVFCNDPARPEASFKVRGDVRLGILVGVTPGASATGVNFGNRVANRPATITIRLKSPKDAPSWQVLGVESAAPEGAQTAFTWETKPADSEEEGMRCLDVVLTHPGRAKTGATVERIRIRTSDPERPEILLDTQINVVPKFLASPVVVRLGQVKRGANLAIRTVYVQAGDGHSDFTVEGVRIEGSGFAAGAPRRVPEGWAVDVRYDGLDRGEGPVSATMVVRIDDPDLPEVRVPLEARVIGG